MGIFSNLFLTEKEIEKELERLNKSQEVLDERFQKKQISNEAYRQRGMENMQKRERLEKKLRKFNR